MTQKTKLKCRSGDTVTVHMNRELVFRRELVLANCREDVTVEQVLSFPIGPIPTKPVRQILYINWNRMFQ